MPAPSAPLAAFHPAVARWFAGRFEAPSPPQAAGWPAIQAGGDTLVAAPTGSGKTLAAFLWCIDSLLRGALDGSLRDETHVVYVSPLKALSNDVRKNLDQPLAEIGEELRAMGLPAPEIRVLVRTGDTPASERQAMVRRPPHILVTTPESLYILLTSESGRAMLRTVRTAIVDEIHAVAGSKRGSHLALSLERLEELAEECGRQAALERGDGAPAGQRAPGVWDGAPASTSPERSPGYRIQRIGLSATQRPIQEFARLLVGAGRVDAAGDPVCTIVDQGYRRDMDLLLEVPPSPLSAVCSNETWEEIYDRLARLISAERTTLVFVNTRRLAERLTFHLSKRLGEDQVTSHHGSLSRQHRLRAEERLKAGELRALVATASLELGIDIGAVDLVCQIGSPRAIATLLQRVGRSGHTLRGRPRGRLFPLTRDELVETAAVLYQVRQGVLDAVRIPEKPLDILGQQIVAAAATRDWGEDDLFDLCRRAYPYRDLARAEFDAVLEMLSEGYAARLGRSGAYLHRDQVQRRVLGRRGARMAAITSGGAIPDNADYQVVLEPQNVLVGTVNEDFAVESMAGDVFQLGASSWRITRIEPGTVRVEDAQGMPPSIPFWLGEAPSRTDEVSEAVSLLRERVAALLPDAAAARRWLQQEVPLEEEPARQIVEYIEAGKRALGVVPSRRTLVLERFFDLSGGMQLVLHAPFGARINRAWGLCLRKRFCRTFNFELQGAANDDAIVLSLGMQHSFPLEEVFSYLHPASARDLLVQAVLASPLFQTRWRWNAGRILAIPRQQGGRKVPMPLQRMKAEDLLAAVFPGALACRENLPGDIPIPDHPLVNEVLRDCLEEAMDVEGFLLVLEDVTQRRVELVAAATTEPSPFAQEIINAKPYAFLDDAPLEERRTQAVYSRRNLETLPDAGSARLDPEAVDRVREQAWPQPESADELHDALLTTGFLTEAEGAPWLPFFEELAAAGRAARIRAPGGQPLWAAAEKLPALLSLRAAGGGGDTTGGRRSNLEVGRAKVGEQPSPSLSLGEGTGEGDAGLGAPEASATGEHAAMGPPSPGGRELQAGGSALPDLLRGRLEALGPVTAEALAAPLGLAPEAVEPGLLALEAEGFALRGRFSDPEGPLEWCDRRLLARIHRYTLDRLRREIEPVSPADFIRFLLSWHHLTPADRLDGPTGLVAVLEQLEGFEAPPATWDGSILPARLMHYSPSWLEELCLSGEVTWARLYPGSAAERAALHGGGGEPLDYPHRGSGAQPQRHRPSGRAAAARVDGRKSGVTRASPVAFVFSDDLPFYLAAGRPAPDALPLSGVAREVLEHLERRGASFFQELVRATRQLTAEVEDALRELIAWGLVTCDGYAGLLSLTSPVRRAPHHQRGGGRLTSFRLAQRGPAGRWSALSSFGVEVDPDERAEFLARSLLRRYGVVFPRLLLREAAPPPWRDLVRVYRRLEARGEIRGGRFVSGFSGEQYALSEAVQHLRALRRRPPDGTSIAVNACDPLNLAGILAPGGRVPAVPANQVVYRDGVPVTQLIRSSHIPHRSRPSLTTSSRPRGYRDPGRPGPEPA